MDKRAENRRPAAGSGLYQAHAAAAPLSTRKTLLIFSGHNDRAVLALCRALGARGRHVSLVASHATDPIHSTAWAPNVCMQRDDRSVDMHLFERIRRSINPALTPVYCPTTEYINRFVMAHRPSIEALGIEVMLPPNDLYDAVTNKGQSADFVRQLCGLEAPAQLEWTAAQAPCVFKPRANVMAGIAHYPILCFDRQEVERTRADLDPRTWLAQAYVVGQSHYLCGYLSSQGGFAFYWQTNLIQQPGGKSIVLAKTGQNPGLDEGKFFSSLAKKGYRGPLMMEIIQTSDRSLFFIEINPRFWGPLQLGVDACPEMIDLYLEDAGLHTDLPPAPSMYATPTDRIVWYAWKKGAQAPSCHLYPAAREISGQELPALLTAHDVYNRDDSRRLHGVH